ncbi:hypothetical protein [Metallibacterium scheffleri]|uniref:hypothetical protein n=1 Tax=Metallibacterium scheffleri TaxID=993689 RepID=UPI00109FD53D|nr:hypothetical protein [Metallibacterium scheffleri]
MNYLRSEAQRFRNQYWLPAALLAASPTCLVLGLIAFAGSHTTLIAEVVSVILLVCGIYILPAFAFLSFRDIKKQRKLLRLDLEIGVVERFEALSDSPSRIPKKASLCESALESIEVLPGSRFILKANNRVPPKRIAAEITETAPPTSNIETSKQPTTVRRTSVLRSFTMEELSEITATAQRLKRNIRIRFFFIAWFILVLMNVTSGMSHGPLRSVPTDIREIILLIATVIAADAIYKFYRLFRVARLLTQDLRDGHLIVVAEHAPPFHTFEVLRHSKLIWSASAQPALWRHSRALIRRSDYLADLNL